MSRRFCFTNYEIGLKPCENVCSYYLYSIETCPDTGRLHQQGYLETHKKTTRLAAGLATHLFGFVGPSVLVCDGSQSQNIIYCTKEAGAEIFEFGTKMVQGARNDLNAVKDMIDNGASLIEIMETHFETYVKYARGIKEAKAMSIMKKIPLEREMEVIVFWGHSGTGKSHRAFHYSPSFYSWEQTKFWEGYDGETTLIIDEFDDNAIAYQTLLKILQGWPLRLDIKGAHACANFKTVILTCEKDPFLWYPYIHPANKWGLVRRITRIEHFARSNSQEVVGNIRQQLQEITTEALVREI